MVGIFRYANGLELMAIAKDKKTAIEELYKRNCETELDKLLYENPQIWWKAHSEYYYIKDVEMWGSNKSKLVITIEEK